MLYQLTRDGLTDAALVEKYQLKSGTTRHSAAQVTNFGMNQSLVSLKAYWFVLYKELAEEPEYPINYQNENGGIAECLTLIDGAEKVWFRMGVCMPP